MQACTHTVHACASGLVFIVKGNWSAGVYFHTASYCLILGIFWYLCCVSTPSVATWSVKTTLDMSLISACLLINLWRRVGDVVPSFPSCGSCPVPITVTKQTTISCMNLSDWIQSSALWTFHIAINVQELYTCHIQLWHVQLYICRLTSPETHHTRPAPLLLACLHVSL